MSPGAIIFFSFPFPYNSLRYGNALDQSFKLQGVKLVYPKHFWSGSKGSWITEAFLFPNETEEIPTMRWRKKKEHPQHQLTKKISSFVPTCRMPCFLWCFHSFILMQIHKSGQVVSQEVLWQYKILSPKQFQGITGTNCDHDNLSVVCCQLSFFCPTIL